MPVAGVQINSLGKMSFHLCNKCRDYWTFCWKVTVGVIKYHHLLLLLDVTWLSYCWRRTDGKTRSGVYNWVSQLKFQITSTRLAGRTMQRAEWFQRLSGSLIADHHISETLFLCIQLLITKSLGSLLICVSFNYI